MNIPFAYSMKYIKQLSLGYYWLGTEDWIECLPLKSSLSNGSKKPYEKPQAEGATEAALEAHSWWGVETHPATTILEVDLWPGGRIKEEVTFQLCFENRVGVSQARICGWEGGTDSRESVSFVREMYAPS